MDVNDKKKSLIESAQTTRAKILTVIESATDEQLQTKVSSHAEAWTILEVVKHLYVSEDGMVKLMQNIKNNIDPNTIPGVPLDFDRDRYNKRQVQKLEELNKKDILEKLNESRNNLVKFVKTLSTEDFPKKGRHASLKVLSIEDIIKVIPAHELEHFEKIEKALK